MSVTGQIDALAARCTAIAAEGTDPVAVAVLLAWTVRPRRGLDLLRRTCRDADDASRRPGPARRLVDAAREAVTVADVAAASRLATSWADLGCRVAVVGDPAYPSRVAEGWPDLDAPNWLVRRGAPNPERPTVAIVGARRASGYGTAVAAWLAEAASDAGARVVSGGAVGVDAAAHRAANGRSGGTTVVLGCGHRVDYPRPHARAGGLFDAVLADGGNLLSELLPDEPPRAGAVRARNRIVASLADVIVVVEGGPRSGALLTAGAAAERGRTVLAVPGDVRAPGSAAPHRLLQEGAAPCTGPDDLLDALGVRARVDEAASAEDAVPVAGGGSGEAGERLSVLPRRVHDQLAAAWPRPMRVDELVAGSGGSIGSVLAAVTRARVAGELSEDASGLRLRRDPGRR